MTFRATPCITYFQCAAVALVIQIARHKRRTVLLSVACIAVPYVSTLSHQQQQEDFQGGKKAISNKFVFLFSLQLLSYAFLILRINERDIIIST